MKEVFYKGKRTRQKEIIYGVLKTLSHPSATMVYERVREEYPNLSRATVFRVLSQFAADGDIKKLEFSDTDVRYDWRTADHYHFRCRCCGNIEDSDFPFMENLLRDVSLPEGYVVEKHDVQFIGLCPACRERGETH